MADLKFVDQHNMVACLEKTEENAEFHQIVDFLSICLINYALTVSPTIYASYIEQFWNNATSKTVNLVKQIHAIVDGKAVVISESSVRSDIFFNDKDSIACLKNDEIFKNLALMGYEQLSTKLTFQKGKVTPLFDSMLVQNQAPEGEGSTIPPEPQPTPSTSQPNVSEPQTESLQTETPPTVSHELQTEAHIEQILPSPSTYHRKHRKTQKHRRAKKVTELPQTSMPSDHGTDEVVHKEGVTGMDTGGSPRRQETMGVLLLRLGGYTPGSDEGRLKLKELIVICTKLSKQVCLDLEKEKDAQAMEILKLKKRVKKLERKRKSSISHPRRRIYRQVESSDDDLDEEDASKWGRKSGSTADQVSTARPEVSAASVPVNVSAATPSTPPTTTTIFGDEDLTIAQTLVKMRSEKAKEKEKGVVLIDEEEPPRLNRSTTTLQPLPTIDPKDKGKGVLVEEEPEKPEKEKLAELDKAQKERQKQEKATNAALVEEFDEIQAIIDVDHELAVRLTHEEQEKYTIKERARLADGSSKNYKIFSEMLDDFDRQDVIDLHRLVNERYEITSPEGYDLLLWGDLKTLFEPNKEDEIWKNHVTPPI
ncbi:hypothetical protein Tco_1237303 [Tanacetum coccineum]